MGSVPSPAPDFETDAEATSSSVTAGPPGPNVSAYSVLAGPVQTRIEIRRSVFLASLVRVDSEEAAREHLAQLRRSHHDARHVCSAFLLGPTRAVQRSNDDGEPSGTAGAPILEALLQREIDAVRDLSDVCAGVVRWFGGVKLGAGGLVRAYSEAVTTALDAAGFLARRRMARFGVLAPVADAGRWENELRGSGVQVTGTDYGAEGARIHLAVPDADSARDGLLQHLAALSGGSAAPVPEGWSWLDTPLDDPRTGTLDDGGRR